MDHWKWALKKEAGDRGEGPLWVGGVDLIPKWRCLLDQTQPGGGLDPPRV